MSRVQETNAELWNWSYIDGKTPNNYCGRIQTCAATDSLLLRSRMQIAGGTVVFPRPGTCTSTYLGTTCARCTQTCAHTRACLACRSAVRAQHIACPYKHVCVCTHAMGTCMRCVCVCTMCAHHSSRCNNMSLRMDPYAGTCTHACANACKCLQTRVWVRGHAYVFAHACMSLQTPSKRVDMHTCACARACMLTSTGQSSNAAAQTERYSRRPQMCTSTKQEQEHASAISDTQHAATSWPASG